MRTTRKQKIDWGRLSAGDQSVIAAGAAGLHALKTERKDYNDWVKVCKALVAVRNAAIKLGGLSGHNASNPLMHPQYKMARGIILDDPKAGDLKEIDAKTVHHCHWLAEHLSQVDKWFAEHPAEKLTLNHPTSIWRRHPLGQKLQKEETAGRNLTKKKKERATVDAVEKAHIEAEGMRDTIKDLNDQLETTRATVTGSTGQWYDLKEHAEESAQNFLEMYKVHGRDALLAFANALLVAVTALPPEPEPEPTAPAPQPSKGKGRSRRKQTDTPAPAPVVTEPAPKPSNRRARGKADEPIANADVVVKNDPQPTVVADKKEPQYTKVQLEAMRSQADNAWDRTTDVAKAAAIAAAIGWGDVRNLNSAQYRILVSLAREKMGWDLNSSEIARKLGLMSRTVKQYCV